MTLFSIENIDYLQGRLLPPPPITVNTPLTQAPPHCRRLLRIRQVGRIARADYPVIEGQRPAALISADLLVGLYAYKVPVAFLLMQDAGGLALHLGVWASPARGEASKVRLDAWEDMLTGLLTGLYPLLDAEPVAVPAPHGLVQGTLVFGIPSLKPAEHYGGALPIDRLIRACSMGGSWAALVLCDPLDESVSARQRSALLAEYLETRAAVQGARLESPMSEHYMKLLDLAATRADRGMAEGAWRVAVYLLGDDLSLAHLSSSWRSVFQGELSLPEPVRLLVSSEVPRLAEAWALPDVEGPPGPGLFQHLFAWQTFLTSSELAIYIHLPTRETEGLAVRPVTFFNVVPKAVTKARTGEPKLTLGPICELTRPTRQEYRIALEELCRHALIVGMTGSGKTNTVKHLLCQLDALDVPFLVVEPAKKEYRQLLDHPRLGHRLQILTLGNERCAPLRLNPFEVEATTPVSVHIDLLRSLFVASFGLWAPMPQILEQCLHEIYEDRGWNIATGKNLRADENADVATFPTLSDLVTKVDEVIAGLGYHTEYTASARAALRTRLNSLRTGAKGYMLDVAQSVPLAVLLQRPTVIELEDIGDDDDKAFLIGLLLLRLAEYRRAEGETKELRHLIVFEEAHRLFAQVSSVGGEERGDPRAKAIETFSNMLAEIRAYGQSVLIADQVPTKLAADVIKNTGLKICHRLVDRAERLAMAGAMVMGEPEASALSSLRRDGGEALVFGEGDDAPLLVRVPKFRLKAGGQATDEAVADKPVADKAVAKAWRTRVAELGHETIYHALATCARYCQPINPRCAEERQDALDPQLQGLIESLVLSLAVAEDESETLKAMEELLKVIRRHLTNLVGLQREDTVRVRCILSHAFSHHLSRCGRDYSWPYGKVRELIDLLLPGLIACIEGEEGDVARVALARFKAAYTANCAGPGPFAACPELCEGFCLFRHALRRRPISPKQRATFVAAVGTLASDFEKSKTGFFEVVRGIADDLLPVGGPIPQRRRAGLCFLLHEIDVLAEYRWDDKARLAKLVLEHVSLEKMEVLP